MEYCQRGRNYTDQDGNKENEKVKTCTMDGKIKDNKNCNRLEQGVEETLEVLRINGSMLLKTL